MKREVETVEKRICLLVLGMHRSGTSALTRVLNIAGAALPATLMGATTYNMTGHWESDVLFQYHETMLAEMGSVWDDWQVLNIDALPVKRRKEIAGEIQNIIEVEYGQAPLFVVKDPRICRFAPLFITALSEADIDVRIALTFRNPLEVCESLEKRDGMSRADAALLWLRHVLDAESATRNLKRTFVSYNHLLGDWKAVYEKTSDQLELADMYSIDAMEPRVGEFLSTGHRHYTRKREDVLRDPVLRDWVGAAYDALLVLARNPGSKKAMDRLDVISREFNNASPILHKLYDTVRSERAKEIADLKNSNEVLGSEIAGFKSALSTSAGKEAELAGTIENLSAKLAVRKGEIDGLEETLSRATDKVSELTKNLASYEGEIDGFKEALFAAEGKEAELETRLAHAQGEANQLEETLSQRGAETTQMRDALSNSHTKITDLTDALTYQRRQTSGVKSALTKLKKKTERLRDDQKEAKSREAELEVRLLQVQGEAIQLEAALAQRGAEIKQMRDVALDSLAKIAELSEALAHQRRQKTDVKSALTKLKKKTELLISEQKEAECREAELIASLDEKENETNLLTAALAEVKEETEALKASLDAESIHSLEQRQAFESSTSWRITAPLRAMKNKGQITVKSSAATGSEDQDISTHDRGASTPEAALPHRKKSKTNAINFLKNSTDIENIDIKHISDCNYQSLSDDPQLISRQKFLLSAGWHSVRIAIQGEGVGVPKLYLDIGDGFCEQNSIDLFPSGKKRYYQAIFYLPSITSSFRFDPSDQKGEFELGTLYIEKLNTIQLGVQLATSAIRLARLNPVVFASKVPRYLRYLSNPYFLQLRPPVALGANVLSYSQWIERRDYNPERDRLTLQSQLDGLDNKPVISILVPVYNTPKVLLNEMIQSVVDQLYPHWELCLADDFSSKSHVQRILREWEARDKRIKVVYRDKNGHISHATNSAFELATGEWIALLDHDDLLRENALAEVAIEINRHPEAEIIYSDEDKLSDKGQRYDPYFKPDFSRELFRSQNYLNHLTVHKANNIKTVGGWRPGYEGSQDYDLNLRIFEIVEEKNIRHIPKVLYHWRAVAGSTAVFGSEKNYAYKAGKRALEDHLVRIGLDAAIEKPKGLPFYRVRVAVPKPQPLVSLIIPTKDGLELLRGCIESIYEKTDYRNYEIIVVDNNSEDPATLAYMDQISEREKLKVLRYPHPFNFSAINNFAVNKANGSIICLINNDIEIISPDWLTEMVSWASQPEIGCVGAKLYYGNDTIQHAGVILGIGGVAGHSHKNFARKHAGYFCRLKLMQNLSAVTAACLLVRKRVYEEVGGFNEMDLTIAFNDVDFCLKVREAGYNNVWTPYAELYHLESVSRGKEDNPEKQTRFAKEVEHMKNTWGDVLLADPYYSPHLTREREDFSIGRL